MAKQYKNKVRLYKQLSEEQALEVTGDTIEALIRKGINRMELTTDENEIITVHIGQPLKQKDSATIDEIVEEAE